MSKLIRSVPDNRVNLILGTGVYLSVQPMRVREEIAMAPFRSFAEARQWLPRHLVIA